MFAINKMSSIIKLVLMDKSVKTVFSNSCEMKAGKIYLRMWSEWISVCPQCVGCIHIYTYVAVVYSILHRVINCKLKSYKYFSVGHEKINLPQGQQTGNCMWGAPLKSARAQQRALKLHTTYQSQLESNYVTVMYYKYYQKHKTAKQW